MMKRRGIAVLDFGGQYVQHDLGIPVLGFCFGHREIAKHAGGAVEHTQREYGAATLHVVGRSPLFEALATSG